MNAKKLGQIRGEIEAARRKPQKQSDLARIAERLGRKRYTKRGKEPIWVSPHKGSMPLSIPYSKGRDLAPGTRNSVLNQLEEDVLVWEEVLAERRDDTEASGKN